MPFQVTAILIAAAIVAASMGLCCFIVTLVMNSIGVPLFPLPSDVKAACNSKHCGSPATRGLKEVADTLRAKGEYAYISGEKPGVYCDRHRPRFADQHPKFRILGAALVWVCLVAGLLATFRAR